MVMSSTASDRAGAYRTGSLVLFTAVAAIVAALGFEYLGGYAPCPLCLQQRWAYYAGIPVLFAALVLVSAQMPRLAAAAFVAVALMFLANAGLGAYHAGVEWKFWEGPATCSTAQPLPGSVTDLMAGLNSGTVSRCDDASWRFAGLSFAGWNVVISLMLFAGAVKAAVAALSQRDGI
jgi:disulfide bond formation protein DsbB